MASSSRHLVGLLAEPARLRVVAALALGAASPEEIVRATGLSPRHVAAACRRLESGGLVSKVEGELRLQEDQFGEAARAETPAGRLDGFWAAHSGVDPATAVVLRSFVRGGQLTRIPAARGKRRIVLEHIAMTFEPGVRYPERQVNQMLQAWHPDHASLRRYLVDEQLLALDAGDYWRIGGHVDVAPPPEDPPQY
jgi:hypothetical protein